MKKISVFVILSLLLTACSPLPENRSKGSPFDSAPYKTYIYPITYKQTAQIANNVYIGEIVSVNENPIIGFTYVAGAETINVKICEYTVKISEVLKGDFVASSQITDRILYDFKDFLVPGGKYLFCTGIDFSKPHEIDPVDHYFEPFEAIKIDGDESIVFCNTVSRMKNYGLFTGALPKDLEGIRGMVKEAIDHPRILAVHSDDIQTP